MIDLMLVAGNKTNDLKDYINRRDAMSVKHAIPNLAGYRTVLMNTIINVDKLIYIYQDTNINIRQDMDLLNSLLTETHFFNVGEIIFFIKVTDETEKGLDYFRITMNQSKFENYKIEKSKKTLTYIQIYDAILGVSQAANVKNKYNKVYLVERNSDINEIYEESNVDFIYEPFNHDNLKAYEEAKILTKRSDSGTITTDNGQDSNITELYDSPVLGKVDIKGIFERKNFFLVSGLPKSGTTSYANILAVSAVQDKKNVMLVNLTDYVDCIDYLDKYKIEHKVYEAKDLLYNKDIEAFKPLNILDLSSLDLDVRLDVIRYLVMHLNKIEADLFIIECNLSNINSLLQFLKPKLNKLYLCCNPLKKELRRAEQYIDLFKNTAPTILQLFNTISWTDSHILTGVEVREFIGSDIKVVLPFDIPDYDVDNGLYKSLMEVRL